MSELVIIATGEVVESMTAVEAERITSRIADKIDAIADNLEQVMPLIREALTRGAWSALGYDSPTAYVSDRFKGALSRLPREVRQPVVAELAASGMSTRAIAPIVGVTRQQVSNDQRQVARDLPPGPQPESPDETVSRPGTVTGLDGKTYTRPEPKPIACDAPTPRPEPKQQRRPITDAFWSALYDLNKKAETLARLVEDDRFDRNRESIATRNLPQMRQTASTVAAVLAALENGS